jgi:isopenicillin N synthase-like dioxygenase
MKSVPLIDVSPLLSTSPPAGALDVLAGEIRAALSSLGFFYVTGHGVPESLVADILADAARFFAEREEFKLEIAMAKAGLRWRGYFPPGGELTSGRPDRKEGIYFGEELSPDHPLVRAGTPLHGPNLWPAGERYEPFRRNVLTYLGSLRALGATLMEGIALSLGLERAYFRGRFGEDPTILFRIFNYQQHRWDEAADEWGVREHTDYGFLTILKQDESGGLQVKGPDGTWIEAPPVPGTFVINIGDMLEYWTHGRYRATPHRVRNQGKGDRLSLPFFYDPGFKSPLTRIPDSELPPPLNAGSPERWDKLNIHSLPATTTYGDFLFAKVKKVFPNLA